MKLSKNEYIAGIAGVIFFLTTIFLYAFEFKHFSNTFDIKKLIVNALLLGAGMGILVAYFFTKNYTDSLEKFKMYVAFVFFGMLMLPLLASLSNRLLGASEPVEEQVVFEKQDAFSQSRFGNVNGDSDGYFLFLEKDNQIIRLKTKKILDPMPKQGDRILIKMKKGFWGCDYFVE